MHDFIAAQAFADDGEATGKPDEGTSKSDVNQGGTASPEQPEQGADSRGADTGGESTASNSAGTDSGQDIQDSGAVDATANEGYETVSPIQFDTALEAVNTKLDALNASCIVLVFAVFVCAGVLCVSTLLRSLEWR